MNIEDPHAHLKATSVADYIRPLALVLFRRDDGAILVAPGFDPVKQQRFYRPLGGGIEFGERAEAAARREIREELGAEIEGPRLLGTFENLFTYLGQPGHELIWLYEARFADPSLYARDILTADESGAKFEVHWVPVSTFAAGEAPLYPDGLLDLITTPNEPTYLQSLRQVPIALEASLEALADQGPLNIEGRDITASILLTLRAYSDAQEAVKKLLDKRYMGAAADFFVETVLFYLKVFLRSHKLPLEAHSERNLTRRRGSRRPDISIWFNDQPIAIIECKTNLGWNRGAWKQDFEAREQAIQLEFPGIECFFVVLTDLNWSGLGDYERAGSTAFTLSRWWPSEIDADNVDSAILNPIEPLFRRLMLLANRQ